MNGAMNKNHPVNSSSVRKNNLLVRTQKTVGRLIKANRKRTHAEGYFWMLNASDLEEDGLQQQKTTLGSTPVS